MSDLKSGSRYPIEFSTLPGFCYMFGNVLIIDHWYILWQKSHLTHSICKMNFSIPSPASEIFDKMVPILLRMCEGEQILIGSRTALAARWCHRKSTDIDPFAKIEDFLAIKEGLESDLAQVGGALDRRSGLDWCRGSFAKD